MNWLAVLALGIAAVIAYLAISGNYGKVATALKNIPFTPGSAGSESPGDNLPPEPSPGGHLKG